MNPSDTVLSSAFDQLDSWLVEQQEKKRTLDPVFCRHLEAARELKQAGWRPANTQNTYLKDFEVPQIVLFDILTNRFPLVKTAQQVAEDLFIKTAKEAESVCLIDIGIGRGFQVIRLLDSLQANTNVSSVFVLGIEISKEAILFTEKELSDRAATSRFKLDFQILHTAVEQISWDQVRSLLPANPSCLLVNASLCLHHIQSQADRMKLFEQVQKLSPDLFIVIEPNADTNNEDYPKRLLNAVEHFSSLYDYVNLLPFDSAESNSLKTFFSNDFIDPVVYPDECRFERLQTASQWNLNAKAAGLQQVDVFSEASGVSIPHLEKLAHEAPTLTFSFEKIPLLSVMGFKGSR